jgi:hypothetical protein
MMLAQCGCKYAGNEMMPNQPGPIQHLKAADNYGTDEIHATAEEHAQALKAGLARTEKWVRSKLGNWREGDRLVVVKAMGHERIIHLRRDDSVASRLAVRVYPMRPARPCPGCGKPIYGIGEVQTDTAPWHLACWELDQAMCEMQASAAWRGLDDLRFDDEGLVR